MLNVDYIRYHLSDIGAEEPVAVISKPRTGSRSLCSVLVDIMGKKSYGTIVDSGHINSRKLDDDSIGSGDYILHGHWHSLDTASDYARSYLQTCHIFTIRRDHLHSWLSAILVMYTGRHRVDPNQMICVPLKYNDMYLQTVGRKKNHDYPDVVELDFDLLYGGSSYANFVKNQSCVENFDELLDHYCSLM